MIEDSTTREKPVPYWVGMAVYLALVGSGVFLAGYWLFDRLTRPSPSELDEVRAVPQVLAQLNARRSPNGVRRSQGANGQITYTVTSTSATLTIVKSNSQPEWSFNFGYTLDDLMTPDQKAAANARFRLNADPAFARSLKLTDEQAAQLKQTPPVTTMIISDVDLAQVKAAFEALLAQTNPATERTLVAAVENAATRSLPATRKNIAERVAQIQSVLKPEQIAPFKP